MAVQKRNDELVDLLKPEFQYRYEPQFGLGIGRSLISSVFGVTNYWPVNNRLFVNTDRIRNVLVDADHGDTPNGFLAGIAPDSAGLVNTWEQGGSDYIDFGAVAPMSSALTNLFVGCWLKLPVASSISDEYIFSRASNPTSTRASWWIRSESGSPGVVTFGLDEATVRSVSITVDRDVWMFVLGHYTGGTTEMFLYIGQNGVITEATINNAPASLSSNATDATRVGNRGGLTAAEYFNGEVSHIFWGRNSQIDHNANMAHAIFQTMRPAFGV